MNIFRNLIERREELNAIRFKIKKYKAAGLKFHDTFFKENGKYVKGQDLFARKVSCKRKEFNRKKFWFMKKI